MTHTLSGSVTVNGRGRSEIFVSNGETLVATGPSGRYRLRVDPVRHRFVFVVVPDYAHSGGDFFLSVAGCLDDPLGVDFALSLDTSKRRRTFAFAQATDLHLRIGGKIALSQQVLHKELKGCLSGWNPAFVVLTGDLTDRGDVRSLRAVRKAVMGLPCPAFPMFGGHDGVEERGRTGVRPEDPRTRQYESVLGPTYYSFDWGGRHFVLFPNEDAFFSPPEREAKTAWLKADLGRHRGKETILFTHVPPSLGFLDRLVRSSVTTVCSAHFHSSRAFDYRGMRVLNTPAFPFGGIDTSPRSYRRVGFKGGRLLAELVPVASSGASKILKTPVAKGRGAGGSLRVLWSRRVEGQVHRAAPVGSGSKVLISLQDESNSGKQGILCLSRESGRSIWRLRTDASVKNSIAVSDGKGVAVSVTGRLTGFDIDRGKVLWEVDLPGYPDRWVYGVPVTDKGVVFAGGKAGYGAFRISDGKQVWYTDPSGEGTDAWPCFAGPLVLKDRVILYLQRSGVVALDKSSGKVVWRRKLDTEYMYPGPKHVGDDVVVAANRGEILLLKGATGRTVWRKQVCRGGHLSALGTDGDLVFAGTQDGELLAYSGKGRLKWRFQAGKELLDTTPYRRRAGSVTSCPIRMGSGYVVCTSDGYANYIDDKKGTVRERWFFGFPISASPCVSDDRLVISDYSGLTAGFTFEK
jgi:outer membrane protein assembly factor BamB